MSDSPDYTIAESVGADAVRQDNGFIEWLDDGLATFSQKFHEAFYEHLGERHHGEIDHDNPISRGIDRMREELGL